MSRPGGDDLRVQLVVSGDRAAALTLEDWMSRVATAIERLTNEVNHLHQQAAEIHGEMAALKSANNDRGQWLRNIWRGSDDLRARVNGLDQRLNSVLEQLNDRFGARSPTEQGMLHHEYAAEYVSLVEQKAVTVARDLFTTGRDKARFVAAICVDLFGDTEVHEQDLMARLPPGAPSHTVQRVREICADARALREKASQGRPQRWDFHCEPGAAVDETRQEVWVGSDLSGVVDFVVAPAYLVDADVRLTKQRVFTTGHLANPSAPVDSVLNDASPAGASAAHYARPGDETAINTGCGINKLPNNRGHAASGN